MTFRQVKHLGKSDAQPPLPQPGKLRLYMMAFCYFSHRVRLVLAAKKIPYEVVNVKLGDELPDWFAQLNANKTQPVLQLDDGRTISDSIVIAEYLDEAYPGDKVRLADPFAHAQEKLVLENFAKIRPMFSKLSNETDFEATLAKFNDELTKFFKNLNGDYFGGSNVSFVDYMVWPWLERLEHLQSAKSVEIADSDTSEKLKGYVGRMKQVSAVREAFTSFPAVLTSISTGSKTGGGMNWDAFLDFSDLQLE
jgi:glutathione S-transferase